MDPFASLPQPAVLKPSLPARRVAVGTGASALAAFCPFCEGLHHHGGEPGERARHCDPDAGTPFASYVLTDGGPAQRPEEALPRGLFVATGHTLRAACERRSADLRRGFVLAMLGLREPCATLSRMGRRGGVSVTVADRTGCGSADRALPADDWTLMTPDGRETSGRGLLDLAGALFGVSPAVVALRAIEAVLGLRLDAEAARGLCSTIAAWDARGRPGPQAGPHPHRA